MGYIGNQITSVPFTFDRLSGDNSRKTFTMSRAPANPASIMVFISGVYKVPEIDYTVSGTDLTFTSAPASGTDNIVVHHISNGVAATQVPVDGSVGTGKIAALAVKGNQIGLTAVSGNNLGVGSVSGNNLGVGSVSGNNIVLNAIRGNNIVAGQITGNLIGVGAISSNHYAGGGVTSDVLSSNLTVSTIRVAETANLITTAISGNYNIHVANSAVYYFVANTTGSVTFNLVANDGTATGTTGTLNDLLRVGQTASIAIALKQGSTRYRANVFIDGVRQSAYWLGNSQPMLQTTQQQSIDAYNFVIIKTAPSAYTVMASNSTFAQANGQGMGPGGNQ